MAITGSKGLLESRTIIGALLVLVAPVLNRLFGVEIDGALQADIAGVLETVIQTIGALLAIYGRIKATKRIGPSGGGAILPVLFLGGLFLLSGCAGIAANPQFGHKECYAAVAGGNLLVQQAAETTERLYSGNFIGFDDADRWRDNAHDAAGLLDNANNFCPVATSAARDLILQAQGIITVLRHEQGKVENGKS